MSITVLEGFAGPGGLSEGMAMVGITDTLGIEVNADACAIAEAAGHPRRTADITTLDPADFPGVDVWASGPPCPTYTAAGRRSGLADMGKVKAGIEAVSDGKPVPTGFADPRTPLLLQTIDFAVELPDVRVVIAEQVPNARPLWEEIGAELTAMHRFESVDVVTVAADDLGAATRRTRVFLIATRDYRPDLSGLPYRARWSCGRFGAGPVEHGPNLGPAIPGVSMAAALAWPAGVMVNTRGARKTSGGNLFSADGPAQSLTGNGARTWYRTDLGSVDGRLTPADAGVLQGFPRDYPWHKAGSRTSAFQRVADSVSPLVAAVVVGAALGLPWEDAVWSRLELIYGHALTGRRRPPRQLDLFTGTAA